MPDQVLIELLYGKGAQANPLACVEDVSLELAGRRTDNLPRSIWQLPSHMNYWIDYELKRIRLENPVYPAHAADSISSETPAADCVDRAAEQWLARRSIIKVSAVLAESAGDPSDEFPVAQQLSAARRPARGHRPALSRP